MQIIKDLRQSRKITQDKLANALGVSRSTISMWEIDASEPDDETIKRIAEHFNENAFETNADCFEVLAHEKGHCDAGAFYSIHTPLITRGYCEHRAWRRTILDNLPFDELMEAFEACKTIDGVTIYDLSEYLEIPPNFIIRAIDTYVRLGKQIL